MLAGKSVQNEELHSTRAWHDSCLQTALHDHIYIFFNFMLTKLISKLPLLLLADKARVSCGVMRKKRPLRKYRRWRWKRKSSRRRRWLKVVQQR